METKKESERMRKRENDRERTRVREREKNIRKMRERYWETQTAPVSRAALSWQSSQKEWICSSTGTGCQQIKSQWKNAVWWCPGARAPQARLLH